MSEVLSRIIDAIQSQLDELREEKRMLQLQKDKAQQTLQAANVRIDAINSAIGEAQGELAAAKLRRIPPADGQSATNEPP